MKPAVNHELFLFESGVKLYKLLHRGSCGRVKVINHTKHKQAQARLTFFHHELMNVQRNFDPTILFPCAESEGETEKDKEGGKGCKRNNSFFCIIWECCLTAEEEVCVCVSVRELE